MAKATAICTCKTCGAKFEKTAIKRNRSECDSWEAWAVETFDECPSCWGKRKREEERSTPVYAEVTVSPFEGKFNIVLRGNTYPFKDSAKQMGFRWMEEPASGAFGLLDMKAPRTAWVYVCNKDGLEDICPKLDAAGIKLESKISDFDALYFRHCQEDKK